MVKSTGVGAREVRAALPSWKFTQCYRDAMQAGNAALEGHVVLDLTLAGNGSVSRVTARGTGQLLSATGNCMMSAVTSATVNATPAPGATAEVDVACTPR